MPPSPWLSARMMNVMYFTTITSTSDQNDERQDAEHVGRVGSTP
jgi:hypothetical protein